MQPLKIMDGESNLQKRVIFDIVSWMDKNRDIFPSASEVIARSGYSRWYFQRLFRKRTGITIGGYLRKRKMAIIAKAVVSNQIRFVLISEKYGYSCVGSFSQAFKRNFGMTPKQWQDSYNMKSRLNAVSGRNILIE